MSESREVGALPAAEALEFRHEVYALEYDHECRLQFALDQLAGANAVAEEIDGRRYTKVSDRVLVFRKAFGPLALIATEITHVDREVVRARAEIHIPYRDIRVLAATGHAEEVRDAHEVNFTSALENAETSAIGRALAAFGLAGDEFASATEVLAAKLEQANLKSDKGTEFLSPEDITKAVTEINACKSLEQLAEAFIKLNPALKVACKAAKNAKQSQLESSAPQGGSRPEKDGSPDHRSEPPAASPRRPARSSGAA